MAARPGAPHFALLSLFLGLVFFAASLTPSLIPRDWLVQGLLAGFVTAIGYMIGRFLLTVWRAAELPEPGAKALRMLQGVVAVPVFTLLAYALSQDANWQNSIRTRIGMEPVVRAEIFKMAMVAIVVFAFFYFLGFVVQRLYDFLRHRLYRVVPQRTANILGLILAAFILFVITRDGVVNTTIDALDKSYAAAQLLFDSASARPNEAWKSGSDASLIDWGAMGQPGRNYVQSGPDAEAIESFTGRPAKNPLRIYVGRAQADTPEERAKTALEEMKRVGAFDRKILIVASPTGTGWMDPGGMDPVEYMHDGDVATVSVQYSYLQSPLALIFETQSGLEQATATMNTVYGYWKSLPAESRPRLYLYGISLGAWSSMYSFNIFQMVNDPIDGALWVGPPFPSELWRRAVDNRNPDSPYVLPRINSGDLIRFSSQFVHPEDLGKVWGRMRIVFLQYASDAIVFFDPLSLFRKPAWITEPPAPDVSPDLVYVPVVTQAQLLIDMALATAVPPLGFGHNYAASDYIDSWAAVTNPEGWSEEDSRRLKMRCGLVNKLGCRN